MKNCKKSETAERKKTDGGCYKAVQEIATVYVFLIMVVYPFYYQDKYYDMGDAKWKFFLLATSAMGIALTAVVGFYTIKNLFKNGLGGFVDIWHRMDFSVTDWMVLFYLASVLISALLSPYKEQVIWGYPGWYMGLAAQVFLVLIYYLVSYGWQWDAMLAGCYLGAAFLVFLLAVVMRFGVDPLGMYQNLDEWDIINFLTTMGQTTWYSAYVALLLPLGVFAFWFYDSRIVRFLAGIFSAVGFMTVVTQNSDSMFIALGIMFLIMFWFSVESNKKFRRFLEVIVLCFTSFKLMGICQLLFSERAVLLDSISLFLSQSRFTWMFLVIVVFGLSVFRIIEKRGKFNIRKIKAVRQILCALVLTSICLAVIYIYLNTTGNLPEQIKSNNNYLLFDECWGNNRGLSWSIAVRSFFKGDMVRKLFGCGPDGFSLYVQRFFAEELGGRSGLLSCAHNEWLNALVNLGILGAAAYAGIFVSAVCRFFKKSGEHPELLAIAISIVCYMGHNFFCYQQVVAAPVVFILIGAGEAVIRYKSRAETV